MAYKNHIILRGLDEARAHQRGDKAGITYDAGLKAERHGKLRIKDDKAVVIDESLTPLERYHNLTPEQRIEIANERGHPTTIAKRHQIGVGKVVRLRRLLREGLLSDSDGVRAEPTREREKTGRKPIDPDLVAAVAAEVGTAREVAERMGVTKTFVYKCRGRANGTC